MSERPQDRQELYDRIRESSKDEVILEEMIRYGFWTQEGRPDDPAEEIQRKGELERTVAALATEASRLRDVDAMKRAARKQRMQEAKARRIETKERREAQRQAKAKAWAERKTRELLYLGAGVSNGLGQQAEQIQPGLPSVPSAPDLASAMGISLGELRWLAFHRKVSTTSHYARFQIPKKTGGTRLISAPMPRLKKAQHWIRAEILERVEVHEAAHGFVRGRSIVSNAAAHVGQRVVINLDLRDFFPSVHYPRVFGLFRSLGFSPETSTVLSLLCTEAEVEEVQLDGRRWFVHASERRLPQGSPCSPALTNLVCRRLDRRLTGLATQLGFTYTRYADDLTFSSTRDNAQVNRLIRAVEHIVDDESFTVHPDKTRIMRRGRRQEVTGLVVNDRLGVPRRLLKQWRATVHQIRRDGPAGKRFGLGPDVMAGLTGFAAFVNMVDAAKGQAMLQQMAELAVSRPAPPAPQPRPTPPAAAPLPPPMPVAEPAPTDEPVRLTESSAPVLRRTRTLDEPEPPLTHQETAKTLIDESRSEVPEVVRPRRRWWQFWKWFSRRG
ncbi:MAG: RNA-directed DNA polymerase [Myxococcales bacterium]|nr:RNA-directed DNA polymerase [Myxococcales bacterium]